MKRESRWIESYKCGCSVEVKIAHWGELPGYCGKHGDEWRERIGPRGGIYRKLADRARAKGRAGR